ncbi:hypothetical protein LTR62_000619 [Meristemomyces frigidus]|uniref:Uncharacterized protein n=1 Tax=Meristemomyces frigidus TaxID=1508187 RepID=A0AAN7T988_9PEZI|nr:hypothetical protein LTR62_000619 [Meristemomyces frigidus]
MPFSKGNTNEVSPGESLRTSMRRLSSIASFQALNPFARRRSDNHTLDSTAASSSSNLSLSSTTLNAPQPPTPHATSQVLSTHDELGPVYTAIPPIPADMASKRSSYICLPDDPIGGMPRSRTFSNLPLPVRARRNTAMASSKSHARLPSSFLQSTRLPSPAVSNRKHSMSQLAANEYQPPIVRSRVARSDTEPLLPVTLDRLGRNGQTTAFKENISMSPVRALPPMASMDDRQSCDTQLPRRYGQSSDWDGFSGGSTPLLSSTPSNLFRSSSPMHPSSHSTKPSFSSPAYRPSRDGGAALGKPAPVQRWNSQPVLTNLTNRRTSRHGSIQERRLLSELRPEAPVPPPTTPLSAELLQPGRRRAMSNVSQLLHVSTRGSSVEKLASGQRTKSPARLGAQQIAKAEPTAYWCGRFSALNDRYRNEELSAHLHSPRTDSDKMHSPAASTKRMRRALEYLHAQCVTAEARESFVVFQLQYAALSGNSELGRPMQLKMPDRMRWGASTSKESSMVGREDGSEVSAGTSEVRKVTFMDKLFGKKRRSLLAV